MNYFEFYGIPVSFNPDQQLVRQKFYELSKRYHPDFYINESEEKQAEVLELATLNNKAFQLLKDPRQIVSYVLKLTGHLADGEQYTLPQGFLMEMMEVNEALMELEFDADEKKKAELAEQISAIEKTVTDHLQQLAQSYDASAGNDQSEQLKTIKDLYYRMKYIARLKERI
ncbi:MAG: Fe-S protein assembly co-chaperone HscB [Pedobacter sp.]|nr:Fe-S protein assembly co-chaperone HscB [Pedobacter sp.]MDQ8053331.1 Fe-S protein assembly co-chaperone HscB [Pedobacter sp.]